MDEPQAKRRRSSPPAEAEAAQFVSSDPQHGHPPAEPPPQAELHSPQAAEEQRTVIEARIIQWEQSGEDELQFEPDLNNFQRKLVHEIAEQKGLSHTSTGKGPDRHVTVCKHSETKKKSRPSKKQEKLFAVRAFRKVFHKRSAARAQEHRDALAHPFTQCSQTTNLQVSGVHAVVTYTNEVNTVNKWCSSNCYTGMPVGVDTESLPAVHPGSARPPALIQLAAPNGAVLLFQVCHVTGLDLPPTHPRSGWPKQLIKLFSDPTTPKAGVAVKGDFRELRKWGGFASVHPQIQGLAQLEDISYKRNVGLKSLAEELLFVDAAGSVALVVPKDLSITISDWEQYPLSEAQMTYAAMDAITSLRLFESPKLRQSGTEGAKGP